MSYYKEEYPADSMGDLRPLVPFVYKEDVWTTKRGADIPYSELTAPHIINIIEMIKRNYNSNTKANKEEKLKTIQRMYAELKKRSSE